MGRPITLEQLRLDVGLVVEKMTQITCVFRRIQLRMEEYVCLKVYILLNQGRLNLHTFLKMVKSFVGASKTRKELHQFSFNLDICARYKELFDCFSFVSIFFLISHHYVYILYCLTNFMSIYLLISHFFIKAVKVYI